MWIFGIKILYAFNAKLLLFVMLINAYKDKEEFEDTKDKQWSTKHYTKNWRLKPVQTGINSGTP
jgi:hypothetical protein